MLYGSGAVVISGASQQDVLSFFIGGPSWIENSWGPYGEDII